jgi:hypothetical protein
MVEQFLQRPWTNVVRCELSASTNNFGLFLFLFPSRCFCSIQMMWVFFFCVSFTDCAEVAAHFAMANGIEVTPDKSQGWPSFSVVEPCFFLTLFSFFLLAQFLFALLLANPFLFLIDLKMVPYRTRKLFSSTPVSCCLCSSPCFLSLSLILFSTPPSFPFAVVDNVVIDPNQPDVAYIGSHPKGVTFLMHAKDHVNRRAPSEVIKVHFKKPYSSESIFLSDGNDLSASAVGFVYKNHIYVGAVHDEGLLRCKI